jgi:glycosyltransferase involved in cell wall biosynthesis
VIHNGIAMNGANGNSRKDPLVESEGPVIVWCGRLQKWKGAHIFIRAAALVRQRFPSAQFLIVGGSLFGLEKDYEKELHQLSAELGLSSCLRFAGHQPTVEPFLQLAEIVVHSSITPDPFGMVCLEAMKLGKPVIASAEGGPSEIIENGISGLLVKPGEPANLAEAIVKLLEYRSLRITMGEAARKRAENFFSINRMIREWEQVYLELIPNRAPVLERLNIG